MLRNPFNPKLPNLTIVLTIATVGLMATQSVGQAQSLPAGLSPEQARQIAGDLTRLDRMDFFRRGQQQLEREIQLLERRTLTSTEDLLRVDETPNLPEDFTPDNRPDPNLQDNPQ